MRKLILSGRLASNAEQKVTKNGTQFIEMRVANNEYVGGADGRETYWFRVSSFNPNHLKLLPYLTKGKPIEVIGDLKASPYVSTQTNKVEPGLEVTANDIMFDNNFGSQQTADGNVNHTATTQAAPAPAAEPAAQPKPRRNPTTATKAVTPPPAATTADDENDDLPF